MLKRLFLITVLILTAVLGTAAIRTPDVAEASTGCSYFSGFFPGISIPDYGRFFGAFEPGDMITISAVPIEPNILEAPTLQANGNMHHMVVNGVTVAGPVAITTPLVYEFTDFGDFTVEHYMTGQGFADITWSCNAIMAVAGCTARVPIPSTAVVGEITQDAVVFWQPGEGTDNVLTAGKTFWMDGVDSTGVYRKTLVSCEWVWVEAAKTGPNFDEVWNGTPLPGHVVD